MTQISHMPKIISGVSRTLSKASNKPTLVFLRIRVQLLHYHDSLVSVTDRLSQSQHLRIPVVSRHRLQFDLKRLRCLYISVNVILYTLHLISAPEGNT